MLDTSNLKKVNQSLKSHPKNEAAKSTRDHYDCLALNYLKQPEIKDCGFEIELTYKKANKQRLSLEQANIIRKRLIQQMDDMQDKIMCAYSSYIVELDRETRAEYVKEGTLSGDSATE